MIGLQFLISLLSPFLYRHGCELREGINSISLYIMVSNLIMLSGLYFDDLFSFLIWYRSFQNSYGIPLIPAADLLALSLRAVSTFSSIGFPREKKTELNFVVDY